MNLRDKVWKEFSIYIRKKWSVNGFVRCYTCQANKFWKEMEAGHFYHGSHRESYMDERNVRPQCNTCNQHKDGAHKIFEAKLLEEYGQDVLDELRRKSKKIWKPSSTELEYMLEYYKQANKER